jgi:hypothetical protein
MRTLVILLSLGAVFAAQAAEIRFDPEPKLLGKFQIVVEGVQERSGKVWLLNLASGKLWELPLVLEGAVLKTPMLQAVRACDTPDEDVKAIEIASVGDTLVAATELGCGLSVTQKIGPREGKPAFEVQILSEEGWMRVCTLSTGRFRVFLRAPFLDRTCDPDPLPGGLVLQVGNERKTVSLRESGPTTGEFVFEFQGKLELDREKAELIYRMEWAEESWSFPALCQTVTFHSAWEKEHTPWENVKLELKVATLEVTVGPMAVFLPTGCRARIDLLRPEEPDEVLWQVSGWGWVSGKTLEIAAEEPALSLPNFPYALLVQVFARAGENWGKAQIAITVVERPHISFVDPESKEKLESLPADASFKIRVEKAMGLADEILKVRLGKLGLHPLPKEVELRRVGEGIYESDPLNPREWQARPGDFLWAELEYPAPITCAIATLLPLR